MEKKLVIFIDSGDTLVDESTETYDQDTEIVLSADMREGAVELMKSLKKEGYKIIMVADGRVQSFKNVHKQHGTYDLFDGFVISEMLGTRKPDPIMFLEGFKLVGLTPEDGGRVMMVGNNLPRDIGGANAINIISVHIKWSPRYEKVPANELETPDYVITEPMELLALANRVNATL